MKNKKILLTLMLVCMATTLNNANAMNGKINPNENKINNNNINKDLLDNKSNIENNNIKNINVNHSENKINNINKYNNSLLINNINNINNTEKKNINPIENNTIISNNKINNINKNLLYDKSNINLNNINNKASNDSMDQLKDIEKIIDNQYKNLEEIKEINIDIYNENNSDNVKNYKYINEMIYKLSEMKKTLEDVISEINNENLQKTQNEKLIKSHTQEIYKLIVMKLINFYCKKVTICAKEIINNNPNNSIPINDYILVQPDLVNCLKKLNKIENKKHEFDQTKLFSLIENENNDELLKIYKELQDFVRIHKKIKIHLRDTATDNKQIKDIKDSIDFKGIDSLLPLNLVRKLIVEKLCIYQSSEEIAKKFLEGIANEIDQTTTNILQLGADGFNLKLDDVNQVIFYLLGLNNLKNSKLSGKDNLFIKSDEENIYNNIYVVKRTSDKIEEYDVYEKAHTQGIKKDLTYIKNKITNTAKAYGKSIIEIISYFEECLEQNNYLSLAEENINLLSNIDKFISEEYKDLKVINVDIYKKFKYNNVENYKNVNEAIDKLSRIKKSLEDIMSEINNDNSQETQNKKPIKTYLKEKHRLIITKLINFYCEKMIICAKEMLNNNPNKSILINDYISTYPIIKDYLKKLNKIENKRHEYDQTRIFTLIEDENNDELLKMHKNFIRINDIHKKLKNYLRNTATDNKQINDINNNINFQKTDLLLDLNLVRKLVMEKLYNYQILYAGQTPIKLKKMFLDEISMEIRQIYLNLMQLDEFDLKLFDKDNINDINLLRKQLNAIKEDDIYEKTHIENIKEDIKYIKKKIANTNNNKSITEYMSYIEEYLKYLSELSLLNETINLIKDVTAYCEKIRHEEDNKDLKFKDSYKTLRGIIIQNKNRIDEINKIKDKSLKYDTKNIKDKVNEKLHEMNVRFENYNRTKGHLEYIINSELQNNNNNISQEEETNINEYIKTIKEGEKKIAFMLNNNQVNKNSELYNPKLKKKIKTIQKIEKLFEMIYPLLINLQDENIKLSYNDILNNIKTINDKISRINKNLKYVKSINKEISNEEIDRKIQYMEHKSKQIYTLTLMNEIENYVKEASSISLKTTEKNQDLRKKYDYLYEKIHSKFYDELENIYPKDSLPDYIFKENNELCKDIIDINKIVKYKKKKIDKIVNEFFKKTVENEFETIKYGNDMIIINKKKPIAEIYKKKFDFDHKIFHNEKWNLEVIMKYYIDKINKILKNDKTSFEGKEIFTKFYDLLCESINKDNYTKETKNKIRSKYFLFHLKALYMLVDIAKNGYDFPGMNNYLMHINNTIKSNKLLCTENNYFIHLGKYLKKIKNSTKGKFEETQYQKILDGYMTILDITNSNENNSVALHILLEI